MGCAIVDGRRKPGHGNAIAIRNHKDDHADRGRLLVLGGWLHGRCRGWGEDDGFRLDWYMSF